ncbi:MAG: EamA family transporter, partial [Candidatus Dormibacteraceae bacterium]
LAITLIVWRNNDNSGQRSFAPTSWKLAIGMGVVGGCAFGLGLVFYSRSPHNSGLWTMLGERSCSFLLLLLLVNYRFGRGGAGAGHLLLRCWTWMTAHHFVMAVAGVSGLFQGVASMAYLNAVRNGPLSVIAVLSTLYPAVTTFLASLFLGERLRRNQLAGLILALVAIVTLSYALKQSG